MPTLLQDLKTTIRSLARAPGHTLAVVLTLGLGIGGATAIFGLVHGVLLRPLPYEDAGRLVRIFTGFPRTGLTGLSLSPGEYVDVRERSESFSQVAAYREGTYTLGGGTPRRVEGAIASANLFRTLGVRPARGRGFVPAEDRAGNEPVVVLGDGLYRQEFGGDPSVIGRTISLDRRSYTVVGVMPPGFDFPDGAALWTPLSLTAEQLSEAERGSRYLRVLARLEAGREIEEARRELSAWVPRWAEEHPTFYRETDFGWSVVGLSDHLLGGVRPALLVLLAGGLLLLGVACANAANLLLGRAVARRSEVALRVALGAGHGPLFRLFLSEGLVLAAGGATVGILLAVWSIDLLPALVPTELPRLDELRPGVAVYAFVSLAALLAALGFAALSLRQASGRRLATALRPAGPTGVKGRAAKRTQAALAVSQIALSFVLLIAAGLLARSFLGLQRVDPGVDPSNVLTARVTLPAAEYAEPERITRFYERLLVRLQGSPAVSAVGAAAILPGTGTAWDISFEIPGRGDGASPDLNTQYRPVTPGFFRTLRVELRRGELFSGAERLDRRLVAVVNETFARRYWPGADPIGQRVRLPLLGVREALHEREIIGVVADVKQSIDASTIPEMYVPHAQQPAPWMALLVRSRSGTDPRDLVGTVTGAVHELDPALPVYAVRTMQEVLASSVAQRRFNLVLIGVFAASALLLAAIGLYGVVAYAVRGRRREIGVRMALGARARDVLTMVLGSGARLAALGTLLGGAIALVATRALRGMLYQVEPTDPSTYLGVAAFVLGIALLASYVPARRAAGVEPMRTLREE